MSAITACRTAALGGHVEQCDDCGATRIAYNSCRNRHCPKCQGLARVQWLADRQAELLPVPYFHVVFTLRAPVGEIAFQNKAATSAVHEPADNHIQGDRPFTAADFAICPDCGGTMRRIAAVPRSCNAAPFSCDTS
jgi:Transposase zinc-binding domain